MGPSARVTSIEALRSFREKLLTFCERVRDALCATQMESRRAHDRLVSELPTYWGQQLRERQEEFAQAQAELHRIKLMRAQDYKVDEVAPKQALARAKARLEQAEEKLEKVRHWSRVLQRTLEEYESRTRRLADLVEGDPPSSVIFLDRVLESLDAYLRMAPPAASFDSPVRDSVSQSSAVETTTTGVPAAPTHERNRS